MIQALTKLINMLHFKHCLITKKIALAFFRGIYKHRFRKSTTSIPLMRHGQKLLRLA